VLCIAGLVSLALIGALALASFVKVYGVVFLGEPRSPAGASAHEVGPLLIVPMAILATLCAVVGVCPSMILRLVAPAVSAMTYDSPAPTLAFDMLSALSRTGLVLIGAVLALMLLRRVLLRGREVTRAPTWGCGYPKPSPRMQYSGGSFAAPVLVTFRRFLGTVEQKEIVGEIFPARGSFAVEYSDVAAERAMFPAARILQHTASKLRVLQQGRIQLYLLYLFGALIVVLVWQLISGR
jgi:NADH:ubiquinone oxidoreductase subunit 5 (subunit L)/multisubunit Na+/H+ antiporter MnhA subunit